MCFAANDLLDACPALAPPRRQRDPAPKDKPVAAVTKCPGLVNIPAPARAVILTILAPRIACVLS